MALGHPVGLASWLGMPGEALSTGWPRAMRIFRHANHRRVQLCTITFERCMNAPYIILF